MARVFPRARSTFGDRRLVYTTSLTESGSVVEHPKAGTVSDVRSIALIELFPPADRPATAPAEWIAVMSGSRLRPDVRVSRRLGDVV